MTYVLTIDGPAGAGKSSTARRLARRLGVRYLDTGAIYRAVALLLDETGIQPSEEEAVRRALTDARVRRRCLEREARGEDVSYEETLAAIRERDRFDSTRETAPLRRPEGAVLLDTSDMSEDEVVECFEDLVRDAVRRGDVEE